jgi:hypothetical protein
MAAKPLALLLRQVRERPEHRALVACARQHAWGCAPEALGLCPGGRAHGAWRLAFWSCALDAPVALSAWRELRAIGVNPLRDRETARRLLALFDAALQTPREALDPQRSPSPVMPDSPGPRDSLDPRAAGAAPQLGVVAAHARREWVAALAQAAYGIDGIAGQSGRAPRVAGDRPGLAALERLVDVRRAPAPPPWLWASGALTRSARDDDVARVVLAPPTPSESQESAPAAGSADGAADGPADGRPGLAVEWLEPLGLEGRAPGRWAAAGRWLPLRGKGSVGPLAAA